MWSLYVQALKLAILPTTTYPVEVGDLPRVYEEPRLRGQSKPSSVIRGRKGANSEGHDPQLQKDASVTLSDHWYRLLYLIAG
jgi:hypothetical protein